MTRIACAAPYGVAGLGQHLAQLVEETRDRGGSLHYYAAQIMPEDSTGEPVEVPGLRWLLHYTPVRFLPAWKGFINGDLFDRAVAARLPSGGEVFHGFSYHAFHSLRRARRLGYPTLLLESTSVHVNHVRRQQQQAAARFGWEQGWLNEAQRRRTLREYALADAIYVTSELSRETFLREGFPPEKLRRRRLAVHPRFAPPAPGCRSRDGVFRVVYVGSLSVLKGIPVLLEAFARFARPDAELTLVGGWGSRAMSSYLREWQRRDPRLRIAPGDPLPHLQRADVCVHPSFTDGFGYAPMEALACGVPVIVTEDTGMKEHVREGVNGYVVPTGDWRAIWEKLEHLSSDSRGRVSAT